MTVPTIQVALNAGEFSPALYGRVDLDKYRKGCSTSRNMYASYRGGVSSRAGTLFTGVCRQGNKNQANSVPPPRDIDFQFSVTQGIVIEAGNAYFRFVSNGAYITEAPTTISGITNASPGVITDNAHGYSNGDEVFLSGIVGPIGNRLNGRSYEVANVTTNTYTLVSVLTGAAINTTTYGAYTSGGSAARIYTLPTPYAAADLVYLKWSQSADVMTFTCVNPTTGTSYPPYDLARITASNWTITKTAFGAALPAPSGISLAEADSGISTPSFYYQFVGTAVDATTGEESVASPIGTVLAVDISAEAATITINLATVTNAGSYNFYGAPAVYKNPPSGGALFGYLGTSFGPSFTDTNVIADFTRSPPLHRNPFATSSLLSVVMTNNGSNYSPTATTATVTSPIGQDPSLTPIVINGQIAWTVVNSGGAGMTGGEAVSFIDTSGGGSGAAATLMVGPASGTFPSCVAYFQQRRIYANTLNQPDTYFASQPGAYTNFDVSVPTVDSDAITGSPWSQQVNGIQWMMNMPGGLVIFTGLGAWQLSGSGGGLATSAALTPSNQVANPQAYNGCSPTVPPIAINYDILYVQEKGSIVRDLSYNFFVNIYTGNDMTVLSNHLFDGYTIIQWGWAEEPNKLLWAVRNDGTLLCLTFLKEQDVYAWTRHDTNGLYQSVCTVSEPPVNAAYFVVKRLIQNDGSPVWAYFQERMDNRIWATQEDAWCVDAGLSYPRNEPTATITVSSAAGVPTLTQPSLVYGGANYSAQTFAEIIDPTGSGALPTLTIAGGVVTAVSVGGTLTGYTDPTFRVVDPTNAGGGSAITIASQNLTTVSASGAIFSNIPGSGEAGDVIRMGGRTMTVVQYVNNDTVIANVTRNQAPTIPNDPLMTPIPATPGNWSIAAPVTTVFGLDHLEGMLVSILADGVVVEPQTVAQGSITLPQPATQIVAGLGFAAQIQTLYLEIPGGVTVQGRRKEIDSAVLRIDATGAPFDVGVNQPDASTQPGQVTVPWGAAPASPMTSVQGVLGNNTPLQPFALNTGDLFTNVFDQLGFTGGQIAIQQTAPLPLSVLAVIPWVRLQDDVEP